MSLYGDNRDYISPQNDNYSQGSFVDFQQQFQPYGSDFGSPQSLVPTAGYASNGYNATATNPGYDSAFNANSAGGLWNDAKDGFSAKGFSDIVGGLGGLYQMFQGNQMMKLAKKDMANRTDAYKTARRDKDNFLAASKSVFA